MNRPNQFIINSQFPTTKNDSRGSGDITIPGSIAIASGTSVSGSGSVLSGSLGATSRGRIASTKNFINWYSAQAIVFNRTGTVGGSPAPYQIIAFMYRSSPSTLTFQVLIHNGYAGTLTTEAGSETIYFYSNQFIAPYA